MRLFTGIPIPPDLTANLSALLQRLRPSAQVRWSSPYNFHVTTKFIGEWPQERLNEVTSALERLDRKGSFPVVISGLGWIPNPHNPRVLFAAVHGGEALEILASQTSSSMEALGIARETRSFRPHLTLARINNSGVPLSALRHAIAQLETTEFGSFTPEAFNLYLSKPGPAGTIYTRLAEFQL